MTATVLVLVETVNEYLPILERQGYHLELAPTPAERKTAIFEHGERFSAVLTRGPLGLTAQEIAALPNLKIICVIGAGYEQVDLQAARHRSIVVTNGAGVNASSVADHAMALLLALVRDIPHCDAALRRGEWPRAARPSLAGKRLGVLGLGAVGMAIAKRAALGFDMSISYHNRRVRNDVPYTFCATPTELARISDFLIIATPGGLDTRQLVNKQTLDALGPKGFLVNVARASVVATADLISALEHRRIAGAALDVFDQEPEVPQALKNLPNVVLTPHVAGLSPEATRAMVELVGQNLTAFFSGKPVLTPVPWPDEER
ncbi:2-hydroxyacid dehydrogenase [Pseudomonas sp. St316]|uniref:2-hydroxyacid dehydrogenase n=1 Tax=Pseudomonas sp. St316 TaxID=2678257 RepID=UPI001BB313C6|nr:2-hydroxyacid dehydrogenase [Pseudomonas sp. St316]BBP58958.1 2-hydroxyacid dehydrogenase [Pseudomonas sp. St316]